MKQVVKTLFVMLSIVMCLTSDTAATSVAQTLKPLSNCAASGQRLKSSESQSWTPLPVMHPSECLKP